MTEKNIFTYKRFLSLNISDFNLLLSENCTPSPEKRHSPLSQQSLSKSCGTVKPPIFDNLIGGSPSTPPPLQKGKGVPTMFLEMH